jgi:hypothetical protein
MENKETFYHGSACCFDKFSLSYLGTGEGKSKFGHGIYITSSYDTAVLYASKASKANGKICSYVYTVEVPQLTDDNHIFSSKPVNEDIIERAEKQIGEILPDEAKSAGKYFRKYIGNILVGNRTTIKKMISKADADAESAVSKFLDSIGVVFLVWPHSQNKPNGATNRAVLNESNIRIVKVEKITHEL